MRRKLIIMRRAKNNSVTAFTILELTVAIAAFALLSIGLLSIINSVSKVVTGGKRLSRLNTIAQMIEYRVRDDLSRIDPSSFLVIRQQLIDGNSDGDPDPVSRSSTDGSGGRPRRVDEILFFATGTYTSSRARLNEEPVESGNVARIYYGHGQPRVPDFERASTYLVPSLDDSMLDQPQMGVAGEDTRFAESSPTRFASDWILARQVVWLAGRRPLNPTAEDFQSRSFRLFDLNPGEAPDLRRMQDNPYQIDYRPAAPSLFRAVNQAYPTLDSDSLVRDSADLKALLSCGIIDIAATDLTTVRNMVYGSAFEEVGGGRFPKDLRSGEEPEDIPASQMLPTPEMSIYRQRPVRLEPLDVIHAWMENLFPAASARGEDIRILGRNEQQRDRGVRLRTEVISPGMLDQLTTSATDNSPPRQAAIALGDLQALQYSNLLAGCTEFIVDWTFNEFTYDDNYRVSRQKWYGLTRYAADTNNDGVLNEEDWILTQPYGREGSSANGYAESFVSIPRNVPDSDPDGDILHPVTPRLIYGFVPEANVTLLTSYFGGVDPTYSREYVTESLNLPDVNDDRAPSADSSFWKWPTQLRFQFSLTDPENPEQEVQFSFTVTLPTRQIGSVF